MRWVIALTASLALAACGLPEAELLLVPITEADAGHDGGPDAGDAGPDAGRDGGVDAGPDAGRDAGADGGVDAGPDAGPDAGRDAGPDAGKDGGCNLGFPDHLDFGKVLTNSSANETIVLWNDGGAACDISMLGLARGSDPAFSTETGTLSLAPGASTSLSVSVTTSAAIMPLFRVGTLDLEWQGAGGTDAGIILTVTVAADCTKTSKVIYTFDEANTLSQFDPATLSFTDIGSLNCSSNSYPFSMSVDENGVAWVLYGDGNLFQVDTATAACYATSYVPDQQGYSVFGMGDIFQSPAGADTLYIAGGGGVSASSARLGSIDFATLQVTDIAPLQIGWPELSGTGDGELWGFVPGSESPGGTSVVAQIDPTTGNTLQTYLLPDVPNSGSWAMKFHGDAFWIFESNQVFEVQRSDGSETTAVEDDGRVVVGAGVSTCATLQ